MTRADIATEMHATALRHSVWMAVLHAQLLGEHEICGQLMSILVAIDELREQREAVQP
jgi:hypothetical protein